MEDTDGAIKLGMLAQTQFTLAHLNSSWLAQPLNKLSTNWHALSITDSSLPVVEGVCMATSDICINDTDLTRCQ